MQQSKAGFLFSFVGPHKKRFLTVVGITTVKAVLAMVPPLLVRELFDHVIIGGDQDRFFMPALLLLAIPVCIAVFSFSQTLSLAILGQRIIFDVRRRLFKHLEAMSLRFYSKFGTGLVVNRLMGDTTTIQTVLTSSLVTVISDVVVCTVASIAALLLNWRLGCILLGLVTLFIVNYKYLRIKMIESKRRTLRTLDRMSAGVQERLNLNLTVRSYGKESEEQGEFAEQTREFVEYGSTYGVTAVNFASNTELLTYCGWGLIYFAGCAMFIRGTMSYGSVIAFTTYAMQVLSPAIRFSMLARQVQDVSIALDRLFELHRETPEVKEPETPVEIKKLRGDVKFEHVHFHYELAKPVLQDFDLHVQPGETIALVGRTGCGKTTVVNLLFRFYDTIRGSVKIDDVDIRQFAPRELRQHFGIVLQEPAFFEAPVAENIRFANARLPRKQVIKAAKMAGIDDFIMEQPDGYDTVIGGRWGITLSAGQQQQLAIARAIAADPQILVMDEATSNLDSESEAKIQAALSEVLKNRTCFVVAHRLSTIRNASRIAIIESGHIVELGPHDELMQIENGIYCNLYERNHDKGVLKDE